MPSEPSIEDVQQQCAALRTRMAARSVTRAYDQALKQVGLRTTQLTLLVAIKYGAPGSIKRLADKLAMERTTLVRNLQLLERDGLVHVGPEGYRRARSMDLTAKGEMKLKEALPVWQDAQASLVEKLGAREWEDARVLLERLSRIA